MTDSGMTVICFFKSKDAREILLWLDMLPYCHQLTIESSSHFFVQTYIPSTETNDLLKHLRSLREQSDEIYVQILLDRTNRGYGHLIHMYSEETKSWRLSYEEFVDKIDTIIKESK